MKVQAKNIMTKDLVTIPSGSPLIDALSLMEKKKFRHLPVVKDTGEIIGILSNRDINYLKNIESIPVEYAMSCPVRYVDQNAPLRTAIFKFLEHKISSLLIADQNENAVGIITTDDLLWYLAYLLEDVKEQRFSISSLFDLQTVGEAARRISKSEI